MYHKNNFNILKKFNNVKTGDIILFSTSSPTGLILKFFSNSNFNHGGIAIRIIKKPIYKDNKIIKYKKKISLTDKGELYFYETNTTKRYDDFFDIWTSGSGFTKLEDIIFKYTQIETRKIKDRFRNKEFKNKIIDFVKLNKGLNFSEGLSPFLSVWLGIYFYEPSSRKDMFCSQLMAYFYSYCLSSQLNHLIKKRTNNNYLSEIFGFGSSTIQNFYTPGHFTSSHSPNSPIFEKGEEIIFTQKINLFYIIFCPFVITLFLTLIICYSLYH